VTEEEWYERWNRDLRYELRRIVWRALIEFSSVTAYAECPPQVELAADRLMYELLETDLSLENFHGYLESLPHFKANEVLHADYQARALGDLPGATSHNQIVEREIAERRRAREEAK
jgi:hypothetical protein